MQTAASESQPGRTTVSPLPTKTDQRTLFYAARKQGHSILASSRIAGVSRATGMRWHKASQASQAEQEARRSLIATKQDLEAKLTEIALHQPDVAPRDQVNAAAQLSKMAGYDAPTVTRHEVIIGTYDQYLELLERRERLAAGGAQAIGGGGEPPKQALAESFSPPEVIAKNSETR